MRRSTKFIKLLRELLTLKSPSMRMFIFGRKAYKELENDELFQSVKDMVLLNEDVSFHKDFYHTIRSRFGRLEKYERICLQIAFGLFCSKPAFKWFQENITCPTWAEERLAKKQANAAKNFKNTFKDGKVKRDPKTGRFVSNMEEYRKLHPNEGGEKNA